MQIPRMAKARQIFDQPKVYDIPTTIKKELASKNLRKRVKPGQKIAITAGSRGITNIPVILKTKIRTHKNNNNILFTMHPLSSFKSAINDFFLIQLPLKITIILCNYLWEN